MKELESDLRLYFMRIYKNGELLDKEDWFTLKLTSNFKRKQLEIIDLIKNKSIIFEAEENYEDLFRMVKSNLEVKR